MPPFDKFIVGLSIFVLGCVSKEGFRILFDRIFNKRNGNGGNGNGYTRYPPYVTRDDVKEVFEDTLKADILPLLMRQTDILSSLANTTSTLKDSVVRLTILSEKNS